MFDAPCSRMPTKASHRGRTVEATWFSTTKENNENTIRNVWKFATQQVN